MIFQVLVDCPSRKIIDGHYLALDLNHQIKFPGKSIRTKMCLIDLICIISVACCFTHLNSPHTEMLAVIIELICTLHTAVSEWEESDMLTQMQLFSYISSLCAQNIKNCRYHAQFSNS